MRLLEDSCCMVIFGASGDLTHRKLIPALYHLFSGNRLPEKFAILGVGRTKDSDASFREKLKLTLIKNEEVSLETLEKFLALLHYIPINTLDNKDYIHLVKKLDEFTKLYQFPSKNILYYLATPPSLYPIIPANLAEYALNKERDGWRRIIIEKPFGYDFNTAKTLDKAIRMHFDESQIYRIDHYLGKETVQNLLVLRFANNLFEPLWNRHYVDYIEITAAESLGVEERGGYYDGAGAVRDMFQNHLLQVLAMVCMEPPSAINANAIRDEIFHLLENIKPLDEKDLQQNLVLGQYTESQIRGESMPAYRDENGVSHHSRTETYIALKMFIENERWRDVPLYVRTGKRLPTRVTEVVIHFKPTTHADFVEHAPQNSLVIRIQPDEGILLNFGLKVPGAGFDVQDAALNFKYDSVENTQILSAYERLLLDAINGDASLFTRSDAVEKCWEFVQPILDFKQSPTALFGYAAGTWGPIESDKLLEQEKRSWRFPCKNLTNTDYCEL